jgi:hypothetical protein
MNPSPISRSTVLVVGDLEAADIRLAAEALRRAAPLVSVADVEQALAWLAAGDRAADLAPVELIVVAQSWPDQFTADDIDRLRRAAPLVRILALGGTWCDGESRTGNPWPADFRASWHQWPVRFRRQLARLAGGDCPAWGLPITTADDERLLWSADFDAPGSRGLVAIQARQWDMARWLADACGLAGYATVWIEPGRAARATGMVAGIWDATCCDPREIAELRSLVAALVGAPVIAVLGFPRAEDCQRVRWAGAAAVLSKPLLLDDLHEELDRQASNSLVAAAARSEVL